MKKNSKMDKLGRFKVFPCGLHGTAKSIRGGRSRKDIQGLGFEEFMRGTNPNQETDPGGLFWTTEIET